MNISTTSIAVLIATLFYSNVSAQSAAIKTQTGYQISKESGGVSLLTTSARLKNGIPNNTKNIITDSQEIIQSRVTTQSRDDEKNKFDFFGGETYKGNSIPYASVTDKDGYTYITGGSSNENQPSGDFFTIKVGPDGQIVWQKREQATIYAVEHGTQITFDNEGNIVVSGLKWNGNDMDIRLIKYSTDGTKIFDTSFDNGTKGLEIPNNLTIDQSGNIYIAGMSWSGNSVDFLTLKYNSNGEKLWHKTENPNGRESWNEATAITTDNNGNVIVTGYSPNAEGWLNYHTIKYNSEGAKIWEQAYNYVSTDPENIADVTNSVPRAITTDADNNIYVTGTFDTYLNRIGTIKYNTDGQEQWTQTYKSEGDLTNAWHIALNNNKLYIGGSHRGGFSNDGTVLLSYETDGTQNWATETNQLIETSNATMSFDSNGNIIIGSNGMTPNAEEPWMQDVAARAYQYSTSGDLLGESAFVISTATGMASMGQMAGIGTDSNGNVYFAVNSYYTQNGYTYETVKSTFSSTAPEKQWSTMYTNLSAPDATMLNSFSDNKGNAISTGSYYSFSDDMLKMNYVLTKHNEDGSIAWNKIYNTENGNLADGILAKADANGNVYVGLVPSFEQSPTVLKLKKISPNGTLLWEKEMPWSTSSSFVLEPNADGTLYIGGRASQNGTSVTNLVGIKLNTDGSEAWKTFVPNINGQVNATKTTSNGQLTLTTRNFTAVQFNTDGSLAWTTPVNVSGQTITATDLHIAKDGSIYINGNTAQQDILIVKLNSAGQMEWNKTFGEQATNEQSYTIRSFSDGGIGVVGYSLNPFTGDIHNVILKYSTDGELLWNAESDNMRYYRDFHIDADDKVYVLNQETISTPPHKIVATLFPIATLLTFDKNGENKDEKAFVGPEYSEYYVSRLIPNSNNKLLLAGTVADQSFYKGFYFFETEHKSTLGLSDQFPTDSKRDVLGQNYPNPVNGNTTIPFTLINGGKVEINLYNIQGQFIRTIKSGTYPKGKNTVILHSKGLPSGIYFYQLKSQGTQQTKKMIIK